MTEIEEHLQAAVEIEKKTISKKFVKTFTPRKDERFTLALRAFTSLSCSHIFILKLTKMLTCQIQILILAFKVLKIVANFQILF